MLAHWEWQKPSIKTFCWCFHLRVGALGEIAWPGKGAKAKARAQRSGVCLKAKAKAKEREERWGRFAGKLDQQNSSKDFLQYFQPSVVVTRDWPMLDSRPFLVPWSTAFTRFNLQPVLSPSLRMFQRGQCSRGDSCNILTYSAQLRIIWNL